MSTNRPLSAYDDGSHPARSDDTHPCPCCGAEIADDLFHDDCPHCEASYYDRYEAANDLNDSEVVR